MSEKKLDNYSKGAKILLVAVLVVALLGVSYAIFRVTARGEKTNEVRTGDVGLVITNESSSGLTIENTVPMEESEALSSVTAYTFDLANTGDYKMSYKLGFVVSSDSTMPASSVRYVLTKDGVDGTSSILGAIQPTYVTSTDSTTSEIVYYIEAGDIEASSTYSYSLKMWIDYHASLEANGLKFSVKAKADGEAIDSSVTTDALTTTAALLTPTDDQVDNMYDDEKKYVSDADYAYRLTDTDSPISYYISATKGTVLIIPVSSTYYVYAFTQNTYGIEIGKWYKTSNLSTFTEYTGTSPISSSTYTKIYDETYFNQILNSFSA